MTFEQYLKNLISFDTTVGKSNLALISFVEYHLKRLGFFTEQFLYSDKANLFAWKQPDKRIIFAAHTDTVPASDNWGSSPFDLVKKAGTYTGLGVVDMKGFLATALEVAEQRCDDPRLAFLLTFNEESDFAGARSIKDSLIDQSDLLILGEPTGGKVMTGHKGLLNLEIRIVGKGGHGSEPTKGVSAIEEAAALITFLKKNIYLSLSEKDQKFTNPAATLNIGKIIGGDAANKIAENTSMLLDLRIIAQAQTKAFIDLVDAFPTKAQIQVNQKILLPPFNISERMLNFCKLLSLPLKSGASYTTEMSFFGQMTKNLLLFGPGEEEQAHQVDESASTNSFALYKEMLLAICDKWR